MSNRRRPAASAPEEVSTAHSVKLVVRNKETGVYSYVWRIGWQRTSFYISPVGSGLGALKVSLHGPDERHPRPGFKWKLDLSHYSPEQAVSIWDTSIEPKHWFTGVMVSDTVVHAVRIRMGWETLQRFNPSAPLPSTPRKRDVARYLEDIPIGYAADIDIYVSSGKPYWPDLAAIKRDNALVPPLRNEANEYLTAIPSKSMILKEPSPDGVQMPAALEPADRIRGVGMAVAEDGLLWAAESITSRRALLAAAIDLGTMPKATLD